MIVSLPVPFRLDGSSLHAKIAVVENTVSHTRGLMLSWRTGRVNMPMGEVGPVLTPVPR